MKRTISWLGAALVASAVLAGCGGGGSSGPYVSTFPVPPAGNNPPPSGGTPPPTVSPYDAFVAYVKDLVATALDTAEPANVANFDPPPTSETADPISTQ